MDANQVALRSPPRSTTDGYEKVFPAFTEPFITGDQEFISGKNATTSKFAKSTKTTMASGRSTFFWVNTNPQSVAGGSREETLKRIRSHVMSEHNRKKRLENTRRYKSKTWKNLAYRPTDAVLQGCLPTGAPRNSDKNSSMAIDYDSRKSSSSPDSEPFANPISAFSACFVMKAVNDFKPKSQALHRRYPAGVLSPLTSYVGQGVRDPFDTAQVRLSDRTLANLQFFLHDLIELGHPFLKHKKGKVQSHWAALVQSDPAPLHAAICSGATNKAVLMGQFFDPSKRWENPCILDALQHKVQTINLVNQQLSNPMTASSDALVGAVSILIAIEIATGSPEHMKIHLNGLRRMVALRNSFADIPPTVRFHIQWTDLRVSWFTIGKPIFPCICYTRPSYMPFLGPDEKFPMASRLLPLMEASAFLAAETIDSIYDLLELAQFTERMRSKVDSFPGSDEDVEDYFNSEVLHVEHSFLNDRFTAFGKLKGDDTIEGCLRWACLLYHNTTIWGFFPQMGAVFTSAITVFEGALRSTISAGQYVLHHDLLIWLITIAACASRYLPQRSYFIRELAIAIGSRGLQDFEEYRSLLTGFFYVDRCYQEPCREIWDEIQMLKEP